MVQPIGILGGTFDPVHNGHLRMALEIRTQLQLDEVRFIPLNIPPHRPPPVASNDHRYNMLLNAVCGIAGLVVDEREVNREETSWTINTVKSLREEFPDNALCLIMGEDAFATLDGWRCWQELIDYVHIVIATRAGEHTMTCSETVRVYLAKHEVLDREKLAACPNGCIYRARIPILEISSTRIRELVCGKQRADFLLPDAVLDYIKDNKLYS